jgi:hypothetical protein
MDLLKDFDFSYFTAGFDNLSSDIQTSIPNAKILLEKAIEVCRGIDSKLRTMSVPKIKYGVAL